MNKNYQQNNNQGKIYNADDMTINQGNQINQSHSGSGDSVVGDKNTENNFQGAKFGGGFAGRDYIGDVYNIINNPAPPPPLTTIPQNIPQKQI